MIVYEREHDFVLTAQHEHGWVAGVDGFPLENRIVELMQRIGKN